MLLNLIFQHHYTLADSMWPIVYLLSCFDEIHQHILGIRAQHLFQKIMKYIIHTLYVWNLNIKSSYLEKIYVDIICCRALYLLVMESNAKFYIDISKEKILIDINIDWKLVSLWIGCRDWLLQWNLAIKCPIWTICINNGRVEDNFHIVNTAQ